MSILVATDLSPRGEAAIERALQLAGQHGAPMRVLFAIDDALPADVADRLRQGAEDAIRSRFLPLATEAGVAATVATRVGRASDAILAEADATDADLIVLGRHRHEDAPNLFLGSTAWRVLRQARRPVLQVRDPAAGPYRRVVAAVDFTRASREALHLACRLATSGELSAVHAFKVPFVGFPLDYETRQEAGGRRRAEVEETIAETLRQATPPVADRPVTVHAEVHAGDVLEVVRRECDRIRPDLLVIGTRGRAGLGGAFQKSIAEALLRRPPCDVAAVAAPEAVSG